MKDAAISGFKCFERLSSWFPSYITSQNGTSPNRQTVDMAYTYIGTATFSNVVVPTPGTYTLTFRYAFQQGLFPGVNHRPESLVVNGTTITPDLDFPVTGNFETFKTVSLAVPLNAGKNKVEMANVATQGVSRVDSMTVTSGGNNACTTKPGAPAGFTAVEDANNAISLKWTASAAPTACQVGYYNLYRSTDPGFIPSEDNEIATVVDATVWEDTTGVCNTPYYYYVAGVDLAGQSVSSAPVTASISQCPTVSSAQINAGGPAEAPYVSDRDFTGGSASSNNAVIDLSGVTGTKAPLAVYQSARGGNFTYTLGGFSPGSTHTVRLQFVEPYFSASNSRTFDISINQVVVMASFDIYVAAGGKKNKAVVFERTESADPQGNFVITFKSDINSALVNAVEVH